jgi:hypothetical protein
MFRSKGVAGLAMGGVQHRAKVSALSYKAAAKKPVVPPQSNVKEGKTRRSIADIFELDRKEAIKRQGLPLWERIRTFPWKFFVTWMLLWSFGGTYAVSAIKGLTPGEKPPQLASISDEAYEKVSVTPDFSKRGVGSFFYSPPAEKPPPAHVKGLSPSIGPMDPSSRS